MVGKEIDPSDIGKHPRIIKAAQMDMSQTDVLVCGKCHSVFHFIELFKDHKDEGCDKESSLRDCRETKPKVWAFLLWKASQLNNSDASSNANSWKLYQTWIKMDESIRETWVVAGKTIQSFARMGQGSLQEMPVKITKTVVDSGSNKTTPTPTTRLVNKINESRPAIKKDDIDPDDPPPKSEPVKLIRKTIGTPVSQPTAKPATSTPISLSKLVNRRANRTIPNTSGQEFEEETVEKIIAKRFNPRRKMHEYLVKWEGFPHEQNTWEPQTHMECCPQLLETFEKQLARQKEQRAAQAAKQAALVAQQQQQQSQHSTQQQTQSGGNIISPGSPSSRPARNSKAKALDQVKQWCADEETNSSSGTKRKHEDSDYEDNPAGEEEEDFEDESIPIHAVKRLKNGNAIAVKVDSKMDVKITPVQPQTTIIKAVNGSIRTTTSETSAEVVITKDSQNSGIVKKTGASPANTSSHKTEAQIRVLSKGENATSGIVRITSASQLSGAQKITQVTTATPTSTPRITQITQRTSQVNTPTTNTVGQAQVSHVQTHRIVMTPKEKGTVSHQQQQQQQSIQRTLTTKVASPTTISSTRTIQSQPKTAIIHRTSLSPSVNQNPSPTSGKMIINRVVKSAPASKNVTPEQKIIQLSKSGDLKVTRKVITHSPQNQQHQQQQQQKPQQQQQQQQHQQHHKRHTIGVTHKTPEPLEPALQDDEYPEPTQSPPRPLTLCPVTGKVLGQAEGEPPVQSPKKEEAPQSGVFHAQPMSAAEQHEDNEELAGGLTLATEDGQQQILASEDGTPLLVTGEDGTIYQVAGKNAEGQTILIAQGADGEQQFAYVAAEEGEEGGVLALDNAVAEAVAQMLPEQQAEALAAAASGGETQFIIKQDEDGNATVTTSEGGTDATQALTIQTGDAGDSQDANIPAEVVQADLPSPGGTRRVVLLLQDGTFMMTEMHDDEYQALNIVT